MGRIRDVVGEFRQTILGRAGIIDACLPPLLCIIIRLLFSFTYAVAAALILALIVGALRLRRGFGFPGKKVSSRTGERIRPRCRL